MYKILISLVILVTTHVAKETPMVLQYTGVQTQHKHSNNEVEKIKIKRGQPKECIDVHVSVEHLFSGDFASEKVSSLCKKSFITTIGQIQPMSIAKGIKTVGEIEVLDFIKNKSTKEPQKYLLIDSRKSNWYEEFTIPNAVNIPYSEMEYDKDLKEDYERMLKLLSIQKVGDKLDFSKSKTLVLFCNGSWCSQSAHAIKILLKMGYPAQKLLWYRGGIQNWLMLGFNTIKPK